MMMYKFGQNVNSYQPEVLENLFTCLEYVVEITAKGITRRSHNHPLVHLNTNSMSIAASADLVYSSIHAYSFGSK